MKINRLETHDRLLEFQKQADLVAQGVQDCIDNVPDTIKTPFYVFGHARTIGMDEKVDIARQMGELDLNKIPSSRMVWMPMPRKPKAVLNSYLFRARKNSDIVEIIWILPPRELWEQYEPGKMTHDETIYFSIQTYLHNKEELEASTEEDLTVEEVDDFREKIRNAAIDKRMKKFSSIDEWIKI